MKFCYTILKIFVPKNYHTCISVIRIKVRFQNIITFDFKLKKGRLKHFVMRLKEEKIAILSFLNTIEFGYNIFY